MTYTAPAQMSIGHVHLKVSDLERSIAFYRDILGLEVQLRFGTQAAFPSAGGYHHHLGLNTWHSAGLPSKGKDQPGLFHTAFLYPDRPTLARALRQVLAQGVEITGAADHAVSEAIYFDDPDGNGIEIYRDRPQNEWPRDADGQIEMINAPLDLDAVLAEA